MALDIEVITEFLHRSRLRRSLQGSGPVQVEAPALSPGPVPEQGQPGIGPQLPEADRRDPELLHRKDEPPGQLCRAGTVGSRVVVIVVQASAATAAAPPSPSAAATTAAWSHAEEQQLQGAQEHQGQHRPCPW